MHPSTEGVQRIYGVLVLDGRNENQFGEETFLAANVIARYAGLAIAQAESGDELRHLYERTLDDMRQAYDAKLVASVLHDGKRMVATVVDALEEIESELKERAFGKRQAQQVKGKLEQLKDLGGLMDVLLRKLKSESEAMEGVSGEPVDLKAVAQRVVNVLSLSEGDFAEINLHAENRAYPIRTREYNLVAVFYNLVSNSIAAIRNNGRKAVIDIGIQDSVRPGYYRVTISDDGPGMPADQLKWARTGKSFSGVPGGFGLGLRTVFTVVKKELGGIINIDSTFGKGTRFIIDLPR